MGYRRKPIVYIVDDDEPLLDAVGLLLKSKDIPARTFSDVDAFLNDYLPGQSGCLLIDILLPGIDGLELQHTLQDIGSILPVVFITDHGDIPIAVEAMKAGAFEFLQKPLSDKAVLNCINKALALGVKNRKELKKTQTVLDHIAKLSPREKQVMLSVTDGKANKVIAQELGLSPRTVEIYRSHVMLKMQVDSTIELVNLLNNGTNIAR